MHQADSAADAAARKMAHPALLPRAGSGSLDDSPLAPAPAAPGPPQSLSLVGPQLKKKSGFQITSVTPAAQISASLSSNNSVAEDTESYDDLDESHTEDLSSSEILDVSLSRATDLGEPERSSSEETLNNFHEAETPGAVSPNQPRLPGPRPHLNGSAHPSAEGPLSAASSARPPPPPPPRRAASGLGTPPAANPLPAKGAANGSGGGGGGPSASGQAPPPPPAGPSRFRVVKLDSSSEPFRKGRWTCTEFYDRESLAAAAAAAAAPEGAAPHKALDTLRHGPPEGASERESTSGSSVSSSSLSTLSHYTESVGSGEMGAPAPQPPGELGSTGPLPPPGLPQSLSQPQLHPEAGYSAQKPPGSGLGGPQQPTGPAVGPPQLPYAQAAPPVPVAAQLQPLAYGPGQAPQVPVQMAPGHMKAANPNSLPGADYVQHQQMLQAPVASMPPGPAMVGTGTPMPAAPAPSVQPSGQTHLAVAPTQPVACAQTPMPAVGAGVQMMNAAPPGAMPPMVQQPLVANQMPPSMMPQNAAPSQVGPSVPAGMIPPGSQAGASSLPQPLVIAPQTTLLPAQSQLPPGEALVPGMAGQQVPAVSPGPAIGAGHCAANVPPPPVSLAPSKNVAPSSSVQNESLVQKLPQSSLTSTGIHLPMPQNVPPLNSAQFSAQSLAASSASRGEEARRSTDPLLVGITHPLGLESGAGIPSALLDGSGSMVPSLFPLKGLPLTAQLMDGEEDGSSGASVVAIDNKIEQAMDLVKSHLMYAVREEVEVLKEQIKELIEKNNQLEQENSLLKTLASPEQLAQFQAQLQTSPSPAPSQPQGTAQQPPQPALPGAGPSA